MPVMPCKKGGKSGYKWGPSGVCFTGPGAKERATAVGRAVYARERGDAMKAEEDDVSQAELEAAIAEVSDADLPEVLAVLPFHPAELRTQWVKKADEELRVVWGEVYIPDIPDVHNEYMTAESIRTMAHRFLGEALTGAVDVQHDNDAREGCYVVESFIARKSDPEFIEGAWVVAMKVEDDDLWTAVKTGRLNGFSIQAEVFIGRKKAIVLDLPPVVEGKTQVASTGDDFHRHGYRVRFDEDGNFLGGETTVETGARSVHKHDIKQRSLTEDAADAAGMTIPTDRHFHRYTLLDRLAARPLEESPGYGEPEEGFVAAAGGTAPQ